MELFLKEMRMQHFLIFVYGKLISFVLKQSYLKLFFEQLRESLGFAISYAYSSFIGVSLKLYLLLGYLTLSMIGYLLVEITLKRKNSSTTGELLVNTIKT
jgi:hypothetical protein